MQIRKISKKNCYSTWNIKMSTMNYMRTFFHIYICRASVCVNIEQNVLYCRTEAIKQHYAKNVDSYKSHTHTQTYNFEWKLIYISHCFYIHIKCFFSTKEPKKESENVPVLRKQTTPKRSMLRLFLISLHFLVFLFSYFFFSIFFCTFLSSGLLNKSECFL